MIEQVLVTILAWIAVFVCWHRAIEKVRTGVSPFRNMFTGITLLSFVFVRAASKPYESDSILWIYGAAFLAIALQFWIIFLVGVRASEENDN